MPSRNRVKIYAPESYYHVYNRGVNKRKIYLDDEDYRVFLNLIKRHLSVKTQKDNRNREFLNLHKEIDLICYCLMPNHFHLFIYQETEDAIRRLIHLVTASYVIYFNKKYKRRGPLFEDVYKASHVMDDRYFAHITRYIHLNPRGYMKWPYSSIAAYVGDYKASWLKPNRVAEIFLSKQDYIEFLSDYESYKEELDTLKHELANNIL